MGILLPSDKRLVYDLVFMTWFVTQGVLLCTFLQCLHRWNIEGGERQD